MIHYILSEPNGTVTAERYRQQLEHLNHNLMQKRPLNASNRRRVILFHDNTRPHVALAVKHTDGAREVLPHPVYSPKLTPSAYHLFRLMQHALENTHFGNYGEIKKWVTEWIALKDKTFYHCGIQLPPEKWEKVTASEDKYFD